MSRYAGSGFTCFASGQRYWIGAAAVAVLVGAGPLRPAAAATGSGSSSPAQPTTTAAGRTDALGYLVSGVTNGRGQTTHLDYDGLSRLTSVHTGDTCTPTSCVTVRYDAGGNLVSRTDPTGVTTYGYDAQHRLTTMTTHGASPTAVTRDQLQTLAAPSATATTPLTG